MTEETLADVMTNEEWLTLSVIANAQKLELDHDNIFLKDYDAWIYIKEGGVTYRHDTDMSSIRHRYISFKYTFFAQFLQYSVCGQIHTAPTGYSPAQQHLSMPLFSQYSDPDPTSPHCVSPPTTARPHCTLPPLSCCQSAASGS
jgi:hypothetical protein